MKNIKNLKPWEFYQLPTYLDCWAVAEGERNDANKIVETEKKSKKA